MGVGCNGSARSGHVSYVWLRVGMAGRVMSARLNTGRAVQGGRGQRAQRVSSGHAYGTVSMAGGRLVSANAAQLRASGTRAGGLSGLGSSYSKRAARAQGLSRLGCQSQGTS